MDEDQFSALLRTEDRIAGGGVVGEQARGVEIVERGIEEVVGDAWIDEPSLGEDRRHEGGKPKLSLERLFDSAVTRSDDPARRFEGSGHNVRGILRRESYGSTSEGLNE
jgi:hypothetical protein